MHTMMCGAHRMTHIYIKLENFIIAFFEIVMNNSLWYKVSNILEKPLVIFNVSYFKVSFSIFHYTYSLSILNASVALI